MSSTEYGSVEPDAPLSSSAITSRLQRGSKHTKASEASESHAGKTVRRHTPLGGSVRVPVRQGAERRILIVPPESQPGEPATAGTRVFLRTPAGHPFP